MKSANEIANNSMTKSFARRYFVHLRFLFVILFFTVYRNQQDYKIMPRSIFQFGSRDVAVVRLLVQIGNYLDKNNIYSKYHIWCHLGICSTFRISTWHHQWYLVIFEFSSILRSWFWILQGVSAFYLWSFCFMLYYWQQS